MFKLSKLSPTNPTILTWVSLTGPTTKQSSSTKFQSTAFKISLCWGTKTSESSTAGVSVFMFLNKLLIAYVENDKIKKLNTNPATQKRTILSCFFIYISPHFIPM